MSLLFIGIMNTKQYSESDLKTFVWAEKVDGSNPTELCDTKLWQQQSKNVEKKPSNVLNKTKQMFPLKCKFF